MLFTAGHALSSGGFLYYFANEFHPSAALFSLLQVAPEVAETAGLFVRPLLSILGGRKRLWITLLIVARIAALGVPAMAFPALRPAGVDPFWVIIASVALWYACQGLSFVAYLSWLSDLAPERQWGRFFAARQMSTIAVNLVVPVVASYARAHWRETFSDEAELWSFVAAFLVGGVLAVTSIVPLLLLPSVPTRSAERSLPSFGMLRRAVADRSFRFVLAQSWWLSCAQGLSQAALFKFQVNALQIPLHIYYAMTSVMLLLQLPLSAWAGRLSDRYGDRRPLFVSLLAVSGAMLFVIAATPDRWWLMFGAYATWGLFGIVNVCSQNLALRLAPASDNTVHFSLFRQIGGLLAGIAGLCGGLWLDRLLQDSTQIDVAGWELDSFQIVFVVSLLGRATAPLWLLGVRKRHTDASAMRR